MENEKNVDVLNSLIEINNDRIEGYKTAIDETEESDLKEMFSQFMSTSKKCKSELVAEVQSLGGTSKEGTKTTGKLYRLFMDMKAAMTGNDRKTILNSCEKGEDVAVEAYEDALNDEQDNLTEQQVSMLTDQHSQIKKDHDTVKSMRDNLVEQN